MKPYISFGLALFFCLSSAFAQNDAQVAKALNLYVDYINENVHTLWIIHTELEDFNGKVNAYRNKFPKTAKERLFEEQLKQGILFQKSKFLTDPNTYKVLPEKIYQRAIAQSQHLPNPHRDTLIEKIDLLRKTVAELIALCDTIESHIAAKAYVNEPELRSCYAYIQHAIGLFDQFIVTKSNIYTKLTSLHESLFELPAENPFVQSTKVLYDVIMYSRQSLHSLRREHDIVITGALQERLKEAIDKATNEKPEFPGAKEAVRTGNTQHPAVQYDIVLQYAQEIMAQTQSYLAADYSKERYPAQNKEYFYFNYKHITKFNRHGQGLAYQYNRLMAKSNLPLLQTAEESHWLRLYYEDMDEEEIFTGEPPFFREETLIPYPTLEGNASNNMILLLDVSQSMNKPDRLPLLKKSLMYLLHLMRPEDKIAIVTYSGEAEVALHSTSASQKERINATINKLESQGKTDVLSGAKLAYRIAKGNYMKGGNNRIILATDGSFLIPATLKNGIKNNAARDIHLTVLSFGENEKRVRAKLQELAELGEGNYRYIQAHNAKEVLLVEAKAVRND